MADLAVAATAAAGGEKQAVDVKVHNNAGGKRDVSGGGSADWGGPRSLQSTTDTWKAPQSAAVERTRRLLRGSISSSAGSESDREFGRPAAGGGNSGLGLVGLGVGDAVVAGGRRAVRLMTAAGGETDFSPRR